MFLIQVPQNHIRDRRNIFFMLSQRRNQNLEYTQPVVQFFAQMRAEFLAGGCQDPDVYRDFVLTTKPPHAQILQDAQ